MSGSLLGRDSAVTGRLLVGELPAYRVTGTPRRIGDVAASLAQRPQQRSRSDHHQQEHRHEHDVHLVRHPGSMVHEQHLVRELEKIAGPRSDIDRQPEFRDG